jgi:hypothetical protein
VLTHCSELAREKMWARIHLIPALQAEEDRDQVRYLADKAREKELLGSETRVYNSDRCVPGMLWEIATNNLLTGSSDQPSRSHRRTRRNKRQTSIIRKFLRKVCIHTRSIRGHWASPTMARCKQLECNGTDLTHVLILLLLLHSRRYRRRHE